MVEKRKSICEKCYLYERVRGNHRCPVFGIYLKQEQSNPAANCEKWNGMETKILFNKTLDLTNQFIGQKCFLLCNGPSRDDFNLALLKGPGIATMTINNGGNDFRSTFWTCQDEAYKFMDSIWRDPTIMKFTSTKNSKGATPDGKSLAYCPNIYYHKRASCHELKDWFIKDSISWNTTKECANVRSTMLAAIHILYVLGFREIYIVGADFKMSKTNKYCFAQDRSEGEIKQNNHSYECINKWFELMKDQFSERSLKVFKCGGGVNVPFIDYNDAIKNCLIDTSPSTEGMYSSKSIRN